MSRIPKQCKRLAEVDFPIAVVSKHSAKEKSIRHGQALRRLEITGKTVVSQEVLFNQFGRVCIDQRPSRD